jgi:hypothetical protein
LRLTPSGVVAGRIMDPDGDSLVGVPVQLARYSYVNGAKQLVIAGGASTNDLGEYRLYGVAPGKYYLRATYLGVAEASLVRPAAPQAEEDYVPTYYPGTIDAATATELNVMPGAELRGVDLTLYKTRTLRIRGRVAFSVEPKGRATIGIMPRGGIMPFLQQRIYPVDSNGRFEVRGVTPGSYLLHVDFQGGKSARQLVEVGSANIDDLILTAGPSVAVRGRVRIDPDTAASLSNIHVTLLSRESGGVFVDAPNTNLKQNGTFELEKVSSDRYNVAFNGLPEGFYVKAIRSGDADVLASGLDLTNGPGADLEIILSPKAGQVSGVVQNPKTQQPAPGATVVLIPQEKERRDQQSYYKTTTTDQTGSFTIKSLVPGTYKAFAWEDIENGAYMDPDFVKPVENSAESVSIVESGQLSLQLNLIPADSAQ